MKKRDLMPSVVLATICIVVALMLAAINMITAPIIESRQNALANEALLEVLPDGKNFEKIELTDAYPESVTAGYKADGGYVFQMTVTGKSSGLVIMCGIDSDGKIVGTKVISNQETPSYAEKVFADIEGTSGKYTGMTLDGFAPYLVSGATLTSDAYSQAVKAALQSAVLAAGGSVDTRTPEEILQDNLNAALGTVGKTFSRWFAVEEIVGVDMVYECSEGRVYVIGDSYIAVKADGSVVNEDASEETKSTVLTLNAAIDASEMTELNELPDGLGKEVTKVYVTSSGNYVFELSARGYDVAFEYSNGHMPGNTPQPIIIMLSISQEGKIIDCMTVKQSETAGLGDACASDDYRNQWAGATNDDVTVVVGAPSYSSNLIPEGSTDLGALSGATYTSQGYQKAVKAAFDAFELLTAEGGNE